MAIINILHSYNYIIGLVCNRYYFERVRSGQIFLNISWSGQRFGGSGPRKVTLKEKEACLEKIAFKAPIDVWIKMLSNDQQQMYLYRVNQKCYDGPLPADH